jgi:hypothetical protein
MEDESALAQEAGPEIVEAPKGDNAAEAEGQVEDQAAEGAEPEEKKSEAAKRREREKAAKQRLADERNTALTELQQMQAARQKVLDAAKAEKEPTETDYPDPFDFQTAKMLWGIEQKLARRDAKQVEEAADAVKSKVQEIDQQERAVIAEAWAAQVAEAKTRYADFEKVAHFAPISDDVAKLVAASDVGADLAYHLGQNPAVARALSSMPLVEAARELGRMEARLQVPKPQTVTNAPEPITPVRGGASVGRDPAKMSYLEFKAYREAGGTVR